MTSVPEDFSLLFMILIGSSHGTKVNKTTLTHRTYHKLNVGDVIKFGFSSRLFIVGVDGETNPEQNNEQVMIAQFRNQENERQQALNSKASMKEQYLEMLRQRGQYKPLVPKKIVNNPADGISWGMVDEDEIRAHEDQDEFKLDPDVLRELPGLEAKDYDKINNYEKKLRQYQGLEREIEIINKKEREEYGLSENEKSKRSALETKVNEAYSKLQMMEDNLRFALFEETKTTKGSFLSLDNLAYPSSQIELPKEEKPIVLRTMSFMIEQSRSSKQKKSLVKWLNKRSLKAKLLSP